MASPLSVVGLKGKAEQDNSFSERHYDMNIFRRKNSQLR
jgi:hypothetical protein